MKRAFLREHKWLVVVLLIGVLALAVSYILFSNSSCCVSARFIGYAFEMPDMRLDLSRGWRTTAQRGVRVARFSISNRCDVPIDCALTAHYTNGVGSFAPRDISLEPHGVTNISGVAGPARLSRTQMNANAKLLSLPSDSVIPSIPNWTNHWRLAIAFRESAPLDGLAEKRYRAALWLSQRKYFRVSRFLNPTRILEVETENIPPDFPGTP